MFPTVTGSNLLRQKLTLPHDFHGELNLVFIPFWQWQQLEVNSWVPWTRELEAETSGLVYYELPTIQSRSALSRMFINEGMRAGIPDPTTRQRTITLYLDKPAFRRTLEMNDEEHIYILLVDRQGQILFRARGPYHPETASALRQAIQQLTGQAVL